MYRMMFYIKIYALSRLTGCEVGKLIDRAKRLYFEEYVQEYEWPLLGGLDQLSEVKKVWCARKGWSEIKLFSEICKWWLSGMAYFDEDRIGGKFAPSVCDITKYSDGTIQWFDRVRANKGLLPDMFEIKDVNGVNCRVAVGALCE